MNYLYIYNANQADFFLQNGLVPVQIGWGSKNDMYVKFVRNEEAEKVFGEWAHRTH